MLNRTTAPISKPIEHIDLIKPERHAFNNGCNLFSFNSDAQELIRIEWIFNNLRFNPLNPLLNPAVNAILTEGTANFTSAQIADKIDFYGAFLQVDHGYDQSTVTLYTLNKHLQHTLPVVKEVLTRSVFPVKEIETFKITNQQKLQVSLQKNDVLARRRFNRALYGNTAYGFAAETSDYDQLNQADMQAHFTEMYQPSNCTIIAAGKIDAVLLDLLNDTFGDGWEPANMASAEIGQPHPEAAADLFYFIEKPGALQSAIRIGRPLINRTHADFPALQVLNTVLGGYFGSRLMANIREDKGYTYGIGSAISSFRYTGALFIATEVGADVCQAALTEVKLELKRLRDELIPESELALVRNYMLGSLLGSLENIMSHAEKFKNIYFSGLGYDYYSYYVETIKNVSSERLQELAGKYLNFDAMYRVIAGKQ